MSTGLDAIVVQVVLRDVSAEVLDKIAAHVSLHLGARTQEPAPYVGEGPELLSTYKAAKLAGVSTKTIRNWIAQGKLRRLQAGRCLRVDRRELLALLESQASASVDVDALAAKILTSKSKR